MRAVMDRINSDMVAYWPQEMEPRSGGYARTQDFRKAKKIAQLLAASTEQIPEAVAHVPLSETERADFLAIVEQLRSGAEELSAAATAQDRRRMQAAMSRIRTTCHGCHAQFGRYTGPLPCDRSSP